MRRHLLLPALLLLAIPHAAESQLRLLVGGGLSAPSGALSDQSDPGFHVQAGLQINIPTLPLGLRADGGVHKLASKSPDIARTEITAGSVSLVYFLPGVGLQPYLLGGYGSYRTKAGLVDAAQSVTDNGYHGGFGVAIGGADFSGFAEIRYVRLDGDQATRMIPFTVGFRF
jgi:hypothetical protein